MSRALVAVATAVGLAAAVVLHATPAAALTQAECTNVAGRRIGIRPGQDVTLSPGSGANAGYFVSEPNDIHVFCTDAAGTADFGFISPISVTVTAVDDGHSGADFEIATSLAGPWFDGATGVTVPVNATGDMTFFVRSNSTDVVDTTVLVRVGTHTETTADCDALPGCTSFAGGPIYSSPFTRTPTATNTPTWTPSRTPRAAAEGCTLGFWKNHTNVWGSVSTSATLEDVFDVPNALGLDGVTLLDALSFGGGPGVDGGARILFKQAVAAYLNATSSNVDYPLTQAQVVSQVNAALASNNRNTMVALGTQLDNANSAETPGFC
jgi:hypothetical protein